MAKHDDLPRQKLRKWLKEHGVSGREFVKEARKLDRGMSLSAAQLSRILTGRSEPTLEQKLAIQALTAIGEPEWDSAVVRRLRRKVSEAA